MKRSKFTSFLFTMVFGLFLAVGANAQSADCQDEVNISVGADCNFSIDSLLFTSWKPSCLYIISAAGDTLTSVGEGTADCDCGIQVDSVSMTADTTIKAYSYNVVAWKRICAMGDDSLFVVSSEVDAAQSMAADDAYTLATGQEVGGSQIDTMSGGLAVIAVASKGAVPDCASGITTIKDTTLTFMKTDTLITVMLDTTQVTRTNEFSHTTPIAWYDGAVIAAPGVMGVTTGSGSGLGTAPHVLGDDATAEYTYHAYNPDCNNWCWGTVNFEFKLTVNTPGRADTVECSDLVTYTRGSGYVATDASTPSFPRSYDSIATILSVDSLGGKIELGVTGSVSTSGDLCDDIVHIRTTTIDHPNDKVADYAGPTDTLVVEADGYKWPQRVITVQCDLISDFSPAGIAEYFAQCDNGVITKGDPATALGTLFGSQYQSNPVTGLTLTGFSGTDICDKVVEAADFNNYGVARAFPYVTNNNELVDEWLRRKLRDLESSGNLTGVTAAHYTVDSLWVPINSTVCNWAASYWDHEIDVCDGEMKILRNWNVVDWCDGTVDDFVQTIHVIDDEAPAIFAASDEFKADDPWSCSRTMAIPTPGLFDGCSDASFYRTEFNGAARRSFGARAAYAPGQTIGFPVGTNTLTYYATDDCGNTSSTTITITIVDKFPPVAICTDEVRVTLTGTANSGGVAKIHKDDLDGGSFAGCNNTIVTKIIRKSAITDLKAQLIAARAQQDDEGRLDFAAPFPGLASRLAGIGFADAIELDCNDVGSVEVILFVYNSVTGYYSHCWSTVTVENKLPPIIVCEDVTIDCDDPIHPDWLGYPHTYAVCGEVDLIWSDEAELDDLCYEGTITRTWTDVNSGASCVQVITISAAGTQNVFDPTTIKWPLHNTGETLAERGLPTGEIIIYAENDHGVCTEFTYDEYNTYRSSNSGSYNIFNDVMRGCSMDDAFECTIGTINEPTWTDPTCGLVGMTSSEEEFTFNDGVCYKRLIHWVVIDWCTYDPKDGFNDSELFEDVAWYVKDRCTGDAYFKFGSVFPDGYYTFTQEVKVYDDTPPEITVENAEMNVGKGNKPDPDGVADACEGNITVTATAEDLCEMTLVDGAELDWAYKVELNGRLLTRGSDIRAVVTSATAANGGNDAGEVPSNEGDFSSYSLTVAGAAGDVVTLKWIVKDGCGNRAEAVSTVTFIDDKAPVLLCYGDLSTNAMSTDGTTEIWAADYGNAYDCDGDEVPVFFKDEDGNLTNSLSYDCTVLNGNTAGTVELNVYAVDGEGNESFCEVSLRIVDSNGACPTENSGAALFGEIVTLDQNAVENAEVFMGEKSMMTGVDGQYAFDNNPMGLTYAIEASKDDNHLNGVSTLDLVLIQKHILGLEQLDSGFKVIAADINNDANVSAIDLVELRKVILGITNEFTNNTSWRFGDAAQTFEDELNPFPTFQEAISVDFLTEDVNRDFIAIKIGDVSGNAIANSLQVDPRSNSSVAFEANDEFVSAGELVSVSFRSNDFAGMNAFQFTMNTAGLELANVISGALDMSTENVAEFDGRLTAAWTSVEAVTSGDELFTLEFRALTDTRLSNAISMTSSITPARAYNSELERFNTTLVFNSEEGSTVGSAFELMQNTPNPFQSETTIGFSLGEAGPATLTVFDVTGKTVRVEAGNFDRGYNEINLTKGELGTSGVLYYQLESGDFIATRKMILID